PVVAGVIGTRRFAYDVWGDTVNLAGRLEQTSEPGRIHVSEAAASILEPEYLTEPRGHVWMKGMGDVSTWFLLGRRSDPAVHVNAAAAAAVSADVAEDPESAIS